MPQWPQVPRSHSGPQRSLSSSSRLRGPCLFMARLAAAALIALCLGARPAAGQSPAGVTVLTLDAAGALVLHGGTWSSGNVAPSTSALLQPAGASGYASAGVYALLANATATSAAATLYAVAFGGSTSAYTGVSGLIVLGAASSQGVVFGLRVTSGGAALSLKHRARMK